MPPFPGRRTEPAPEAVSLGGCRWPAADCLPRLGAFRLLFRLGGRSERRVGAGVDLPDGSPVSEAIVKKGWQEVSRDRADAPAERRVQWVDENAQSVEGNARQAEAKADGAGAKQPPVTP